MNFRKYLAEGYEIACYTIDTLTNLLIVNWDNVLYDIFYQSLSNTTTLNITIILNLNVIDYIWKSEECNYSSKSLKAYFIILRS